MEKSSKYQSPCLKMLLDMEREIVRLYDQLTYMDEYASQVLQSVPKGYDRLFGDITDAVYSVRDMIAEEKKSTKS